MSAKRVPLRIRVVAAALAVAALVWWFGLNGDRSAGRGLFAAAGSNPSVLASGLRPGEPQSERSGEMPASGRPLNFKIFLNGSRDA